MLRRLLAVTILLLALPASAQAQSVVDDDASVTSSAPGRLDVTARAADGTVVVRSLDTASGAWSPWTAVRGIAANAGPRISADDDGTLHLFARTGDGVVESALRGGTWSAWTTPSPNQALTGAGTANRDGTTELDIGVIGLDGAFFHAYRPSPDAPFSAFGRVAAFGTTTPALVSRGPSLLDAFTRAQDGSITNIRYLPGSGWTATGIGGTVVGAISAITRAPSQMDVYARGINGDIYANTFDGSAWVGFVTIMPGVGTSAPAAATTGGGRVDMVVRDATTLYHAVFTPATGWSGLAPVGPIEAPVDRGAVNGAGGGDGARVSLRLPGKRPAARTYKLGGKVRLRGQVVDAAGAPVMGANVVLRSTRLARGAAPSTLAVVPTGADGGFARTVEAGPGQRISAEYVAYANDATAAASAVVTARTRARAALKTSRKRVRRGQRVRFTGRLRGGAIPDGGKLVVLQARERGRWRTFASPRSNAKGRFASRYRFGASPSRPVRLRFRAVVPREASYPFVRGVSKARTIVLRP